MEKWTSGVLVFFFFFFLSHSLLPAVDLQNRSMSFGQASARVNHFRIYCLVHNASLQSLFVCPVNCGGPANVGQSTGAGQTRQWALCRSFDLFFFFFSLVLFFFSPLFFQHCLCVSRHYDRTLKRCVCLCHCVTHADPQAEEGECVTASSLPLFVSNRDFLRHS